MRVPQMNVDPSWGRGYQAWDGLLWNDDKVVEEKRSLKKHNNDSCFKLIILQSLHSHGENVPSLTIRE